jgi:hypothetical protein
MQEEAEIEVEETNEDSTAEAEEQDHSIPKHRFDALAAELRRAKEDLRHKDVALTQLQGALVPRQREESEDLDEAELEQMGLDPKTYRFLSKKFDQKLEKKAKAFEQHTRSMIGGLANTMEEKSFVADFGKEAGKLLPKIRAMRQEQAAQGSYLSVEMAYKIMVADEALNKASKPAQKKSEKSETAAEKVEKTETQKTQAKAPGAGKSIEDWENELDEKIKAGSGRI